LEAWIRSASDANEDIDPVGLQAELLSWAIQARILEGVMVERGLTVSPELLVGVRAEIVGLVGGEEALDATLADIGFPQDFFADVFVARQAAIDALTLDLSSGPLETRLARHILVETSEEANEIYELLLEGAEFTDLALERSTDTGSNFIGGDLGPARRDRYTPVFDAAVWSAPLDTVLEPFETDFGFHIVEVYASFSTAESFSLEQRRGLVEQDLDLAISTAFRAAVVTIDPTIGTWDALGARVLPVGRSN
jgi:hypothetical protein